MNDSKASFKVRELLADLEWVAVCANSDLGKFGEWQADYCIPRREIKEELAIAMAALKGKPV